MAWIAVDADGTAYKYGKKPIRATDCWMVDHSDDEMCNEISLSEVEMLTGKQLRWNNEPIEVI